MVVPATEVVVRSPNGRLLGAALVDVVRRCGLEVRSPLVLTATAARIIEILGGLRDGRPA